MMTSTVSETTSVTEDDQYRQLLSCVRERFTRATTATPPPALFTTNAAGLFDAFLDALPPGRRQHYTCNACRRFVERFGGVVKVEPDGSQVSPFWDPADAPPFFAASVRAIAKLVARAKVTGVFLCIDRVWGLPSNRQTVPGQVRTWHHLAVTPPPALVHKLPRGQTIEGAMAVKGEEHGMLCRGLAEFPIEVVRQAHTLLTNGQLYRSEKCIGPAKWLLDLHEAREATKNSAARDNLAWRAAATAPAGFCHVRSSMIGTLLEDLAANLPFADIKAKFDAKMNPLIYQRPQTAPSAGNIAQAEKLVAELQAAGALARRFAKIEDVEALWKPKAREATPPPGGVFGHLLTKTAPAKSVDAPPVVMTWEKFARTVLPDAETIEFFAPSRNTGYFGMVTAANPDAPPILQWDREERRNPVSWYFYHGGSAPEQWNLTRSAWHEVTAITLKPSSWYGAPSAHQGEGVFFILKGARDLRYTSGAGFFPECLRSEYHGVRRTMEAYAASAVVAGAAEATACGIALQKGQPWDHLFRVTSKGTTVTYKLDRWD